MIKSVIELCRSVLKQDRVRISPSEGRLLRLSPPCVLTIGRRTVRIVSRAVSETVSGPIVTYECETDAGEADLIVRLTRTLKSDVSLRENGIERELAESDFVVFGEVSR